MLTVCPFAASTECIRVDIFARPTQQKPESSKRSFRKKCSRAASRFTGRTAVLAVVALLFVMQACSWSLTGCFACPHRQSVSLLRRDHLAVSNLSDELGRRSLQSAGAHAVHCHPCSCNARDSVLGCTCGQPQIQIHAENAQHAAGRACIEYRLTENTNEKTLCCAGVQNFQMAESSGPPLIPRILHQTYRSDDIPAHLMPYMQSWREVHPEWEIRFYDDDACKHMVKQEFPEYLSAFEALPTNVERADFFR